MTARNRCQTTCALMALPIWIIAIRDPAYAYMLRSSGVRRPRTTLRRRRAGSVSFGYAPRGATRRPPTAEAVRDLEARAAASNAAFTATLRDVETRHGELIRETASALLRTGSALLPTSAGDIEARIIPFRRDAVVLEINFPGGRIQSRSTRSSDGQAGRSPARSCPGFDASGSAATRLAIPEADPNHPVTLRARPESCFEPPSHGR